MKNLKIISIMLIPLLWTACQPGTGEGKFAKEKHLQQKPPSKLEVVLSPEERSLLTPEKVVEKLLAGNQRFVNNDLTARNHSKQRRDAALGQFPKGIVLACIDSRVPVEDIFDTGIGDLFVARVGGNIVNEDVLGSVEYACKVAGAKVVMVLGHEHCSTVVSAIDKVDLGHIPHLTTKIQPAIDQVVASGEQRSSLNTVFVEQVVKNNVQQTIQELKQTSPVLQKMEETGQVKIVGGYYDLDEGLVHLLE